jgi:dihydroflavonol-4-reductase
VTVHATVRDPTQTSRLQYLIDLAEKSPGTIKFFKGDLMEEGSFAEGMKGCSVVFHVASPFVLTVKDPKKDLVDPAVNGTCEVLNEATKAGTVKRVVLTSSCAAIYNDCSDTYKAPGHVLTEDIWNTGSNLKYNPYNFSKTKAELKAWEIAGSQTNWTLVVMNPCMVLGPGVIYHETSESCTLLRRLGNGEFESGSPNFCMGVVDVRDVAHAHIVGAFSKSAKGRYILRSVNTGLKDMAKILHEKYPDYRLPTRTLPKLIFWLLAPYVGISRQVAWNNTDVPINLDNSKSIRELGIQYRPLSDSLNDLFQQMIDAGVLQKKK